MKMSYNDISDGDYELIELNDEGHWYIELKTQPYEGIKYRYGAVRVADEPDDGSDVCTLTFDFEIFGDDDYLNQDVDFNNYIGDVLSHIIVTSLEQNVGHIGEKKNGNTVNTNNNTKESSAE